jgi:hypothetical protein
MSSEKTPNQQLLLLHLGLLGGRALQREVKYKEIAKDRKALERRGFLAVATQGHSLSLKLEDDGWDELTRSASVLPKGKKKPSRERTILQLLLNALHGDASRRSVGIGEILRPAPTAHESTTIQQRIRRAFFEIAGNPPQDSVRLSALRASLYDVPPKQLDEVLLAMKSAGEINLMNLDNPPDIKAEEPSALRDGTRHYHVLWIER